MIESPQCEDTGGVARSAPVAEGRPQRPRRPNHGPTTALKPIAIAQVVAALDGLDLEGLRRQWRDRYGEAPRLRSPELLRLMLAWRIQTAVMGGLDASLRQQLRRGPAELGAGTNLPVGTRLTREWKGVSHEVWVTKEGYAWKGQTYLSLSAIARAITGARWNGPRFFGLRDGGAGR